MIGDNIRCIGLCSLCLAFRRGRRCLGRSRRRTSRFVWKVYRCVGTRPRNFLCSWNLGLLFKIGTVRRWLWGLHRHSDRIQEFYPLSMNEFQFLNSMKYCSIYCLKHNSTCFARISASSGSGAPPGRLQVPLQFGSLKVISVCWPPW